ncbi:MAG: hypothetical protein WCJ41_20715 [Aestuariivirga sp.]|uniref:hypothetical protein n=1 Tax=Aestuariivirga sp. TaxID=2650926 RepID=UPI003016F28E
MARLKRGVIHSFVTGSRGRPQLALEAKAYWAEPEGKDWLSTPVALLPTRVLQLPGPVIIGLDVVAGLAMQTKEDDLYRLLVVESTASPGAADAARSRHADAWDYVRDARVVAGALVDTWQGSVTKIGADRLAGLFHEVVEVRGPAYLTSARGVPVALDSRLTAVQFTRYVEAKDTLPIASLKSALASATDIRNTPRAGEEVLLATPAEAIGAALMLAVWALHNNPPPAELKPGQSRTLSRASGVA